MKQPKILRCKPPEFAPVAPRDTRALGLHPTASWRRSGRKWPGSVALANGEAHGSLQQSNIEGIWNLTQKRRGRMLMDFPLRSIAKSIFGRYKWHSPKSLRPRNTSSSGLSKTCRGFLPLPFMKSSQMQSLTDEFILICPFAYGDSLV